MADSKRPGCGAISPWVGSARSHCVFRHGHRGKHSWETAQGQESLREAAQEATQRIKIIGAIGTVIELVNAATEAVTNAREAGLPRPAQVAAIVANVGFVDAWDRAPDGARRDLLTTGARMAVEADVPAGKLEPNSNAAMLLDLAQSERAKDPAAPITADSPVAQPAGPTGIYAISLVCDSTEPEEAKRAAYALLALLAAEGEKVNGS
jgi:hypothetical protein